MQVSKSQSLAQLMCVHTQPSNFTAQSHLYLMVVRWLCEMLLGKCITQSTSNYVLLKNSNIPSQIVGLQINHALPYDNGTVYTCTDGLAPDNFESSTVLSITSRVCIGDIFCMSTYVYTECVHWELEPVNCFVLNCPINSFFNTIKL